MTQSMDFSSSDKALPSNIEAEEVVLGGILLDPDAMLRVITILDSDAFYLTSHNLIYKACLHLCGNNRPIDLFTVSAWLTDHELIKEIGGKSKLAQLVDRTVSSVNVDAVATLVQEKHLSRKLISASNAINKLGYDQSEPIAQRIDMSESKIFALRHQSGTESDSRTLADACVGLFQKIEETAESGIKPGFYTGFYDLDTQLGGGVFPGDLIVVAGRPSMGKSLFAHSLAYQIAQHHQAPTMIFTLEMSTEQVVTRFLSSAAKISTNVIREGNLSERQWESLAQAVAEISKVPVIINDSACPSPYEIRSKVRQAIAQHGDLKLVVIDYLQLMVDGSDMRLVQKIGELTRQLKLLARECNVPILLVSQLNRDVESQNNKRPCLNHLRDSGRIEEDADVVLGIYRDLYYNPDTVDTNIAEIICLKQRNGALGSVKLLFDGEFSQFLNLAK